MSKTNIYIFKGLHIVSWIIFVGLSIEAGSLLVNFVFSIYKPEFVQNLYQKLDLSEIYKASHWAFFNLYSFILSISILKACLFYLVILLIMKLDLSKPFNRIVLKKLNQISSFAFAIGIIGVLARNTAKTMQHHGFATEFLNQFWADGEAFILMAAVVYIIATIFKIGINLQEENDLTV